MDSAAVVEYVHQPEALQIAIEAIICKALFCGASALAKGQRCAAFSCKQSNPLTGPGHPWRRSAPSLLVCSALHARLSKIADGIPYAIAAEWRNRIAVRFNVAYWSAGYDEQQSREDVGPWEVSAL
jgi:hypothetical protein